VENFQYNNLFDNSKAKRDLGFRYTVKFEEGVRRCLEHLSRKGGVEDSDRYPFYDQVVEAWTRHITALEAELAGVIA
jgi:hypothetical protein